MEFARLKPGRGFMPVHSALYYGQRIVTPRRARAMTVALLCRWINRRQRRTHHPALTADQQALLDRFENDGYVPLPPLLDAAQIADIRAFLADRPLRHRHASQDSVFRLDQRPADVDVVDYTLADIVAAPHILALANSDFLLGLAETYIGCKPTLSALVLRWSFPRHGTGRGIQAFHRDGDDWRHVKIFVYLTDVDAGAGPHVYVIGSQKGRAPLRLREYSDADIDDTYGADRVMTVVGPAGFSFAGDTAGIHKGLVPSDTPRLMLQIQYSLLPSYIYRYRAVPYDGPVPLDEYTNRLIVSRTGRLASAA